MTRRKDMKSHAAPVPAFETEVKAFVTQRMPDLLRAAQGHSLGEALDPNRYLWEWFATLTLDLEPKRDEPLANGPTVGVAASMRRSHSMGSCSFQIGNGQKLGGGSVPHQPRPPSNAVPSSQASVEEVTTGILGTVSAGRSCSWCP